ncbi:MAG: UDP-glucose/GDP-mannose dehydrogenase family protein [Chloroflexi bacterium]|jgi:GDP-mannose 6-dehydrogenase|nr:UDP-glucose/GDP-mannose dehydrogenase family protein [Chloroflexota bacterium]
MNISVFGLGYVGTVTAVCLSKKGHNVLGIDAKSAKNEAINRGVAPVIENGIEELVKLGLNNGTLRATESVEDAIQNSELSFICVGTPSNLDGSLNLEHIIRVCEQIGKALSAKSKYHVIVTRSTMLPGSMEDEILPVLENASGKKSGIDFGVCVNPEFMREGEAVYDFFNPERIVIGELDARAGDRVAHIYQDIDAPIVRCDIKSAEMVKYVDNTFHAVKITFANEIGSICGKLGIDSYQVMDIFCLDRKLNISSHYLKPGFAYGGSCLPKDIRALTAKSAELKLRNPLLEAVSESNRAHIDRAVNLIMGLGTRRIGILGLSFKSGTTDTRESPSVALIHRLYEKGYSRLFDKGYDITVYDPSLQRTEMDNLPPHIASLLTLDLEDIINNSDVIVITRQDKYFERLNEMITNDHTIVDLAGAMRRSLMQKGSYVGIC